MYQFVQTLPHIFPLTLRNVMRLAYFDKIFLRNPSWNRQLIRANNFWHRMPPAVESLIVV